MKEKLMKEIRLNIEEEKLNFFLELIGNFDFIKIDENKLNETDVQIIQNIRVGLEEIKQIKAGKHASRPAKEFLNEL